MPTIWARVNVRKDGAIGIVYPLYFRFEWTTPVDPISAIIDECRSKGYETHGIVAWDAGHEAP